MTISSSAPPDGSEPPLDAAVDRLRRQPDRGWGVREGLLAVGAVLLSFVVTVAVVLATGSGGAATAAGEAALVVMVFRLARRAARGSGGWDAALGLGPPRPRDAGTVVGWTILLTLLQAGVVQLLLSADPSLHAPDNTGGAKGLSAAALAGFVALTVVVAPVVEEVVFRGLLLRGLMLRMGFWPAAGISSALFGALHAPGAEAGALPLTVAMAVFGLCLCLLVRHRGRLVLTIGVHALRNALAVALLLAS